MRGRAVLAMLVVAGIAGMVGYAAWYSKAVVTAPFPSALASVKTTLNDADSAKLLQIVAAQRRQLGVPSLQVAVIVPGRGYWTGAVGWADPKKKRAVSVADAYHIGSVSKLFTVAVIMKLAEQGALSLDDPVTKFFPAFPGG